MKKRQKYSLPQIGRTFGDWVVVSHETTNQHPSSHGKYVSARCTCGQEKNIRVSTLYRGETLQCVNCRAQKLTRTKLWSGVGELPQSYFYHLEWGAKNRNIEFNLTKEYLWDLFQQQNQKCALSGIDLRFYTYYRNKTEQTASLDRINSLKGYVAGNVQWIHKDINKMKNVFGEEIFVKLCRLIAQQSSKIDTKIIVRLQVEGLHCWSTCDIDEVSFLKNLHRHQFHIIGTKAVEHDDRDIEFIKLSHDIKNYLHKKYYSDQYKCLNFGSQSCEMLARELIEMFKLNSCEFNEDGEGGALLVKGDL